MTSRFTYLVNLHLRWLIYGIRKSAENFVASKLYFFHRERVINILHFYYFENLIFFFKIHIKYELQNFPFTINLFMEIRLFKVTIRLRNESSYSCKCIFIKHKHKNMMQYSSVLDLLHHIFKNEIAHVNFDHLHKDYPTN